MSENNKNDWNADEVAKELNNLFETTMKSVRDFSKNAFDAIDTEKRKAEIRSEIGHNSRELSKIYEQLGRSYFDSHELGKEFTPEAEAIDRIRSKEKLNQLLKEKLEGLEK